MKTLSIRARGGAAIRYLRSFTATLLAALMVAPSGASAAEWADRVFLGGPILTMDADGRVVDGLAIRDGRIAAVGDEASVRALVGPATVVTDLRGRALLPGFIDSHSHFLGVGTTALYDVDLNSPPIGRVRSIDDIVSLLAERAKHVPAGGTITARGYDDSLLAERRHPDRHDLDRASTAHRIIIRHISGHFSAANSYAIAASGITQESRTPVGGVIRREASGEPNGVFEESAAALLKRGPDNTLGRGRQFAAVEYASKLYLAQGVTTAQHGSTSLEAFETLKAADERALIGPRLVVLPSRALALTLSAPEPGRIVGQGLIVGPVKLFADGSIQGYTGHLSEPYHTSPGEDASYRGYPSQPCARLKGRAVELARKGWRIAVHGNGDAAIDCILDVAEAASARSPLRDFRPIVIHAQMTRPDQLDRMKALGVLPSFFSLHAFYWGDRHRDRFIGPERGQSISPTASAARRGIRFTVHTDSPVVPYDSMRMLWATVNRETTSGAVLGGQERVSVMEALRAMTSHAAYQYGLEAQVGSLEAGKLADLVVLSANPLAIDPRALNNLEVVETIVGGQTRFLDP